MRSVFKGLDGKTFNSVAEACEAIEGFDWNCVSRPIRYADENGEFTLGYSDKVMNVWEHNDVPLGIVGNKYVQNQYRDGFEIATPLIENGGFLGKGGGLLNRGERAVLVLESSDVMELGPGITIVNRIILLSSHDGTGKLELKVTPYCKETGTAQTLDVSGLSFKHTKNMNSRIASGRRALKRIEGAWAEFTDAAKRMQTVTLTDAEARSFIEEILPAGKKDASTRLENLREDIYQVYKNTGLLHANPVCRGTMFGLVQAVAEFVDHRSTVRASAKRNEETCAFDAHFLNAGAKKKASAFAHAKKLMSLKYLRKTA